MSRRVREFATHVANNFGDRSLRIVHETEDVGDDADRISGPLQHPSMEGSQRIALTAQAEEHLLLHGSGERLDYELTIEDPGTLLAPYSWEGFWIWRPGEEVGRYECTVE